MAEVPEAMRGTGAGRRAAIDLFFRFLLDLLEFDVLAHRVVDPFLGRVGCFVDLHVAFAAATRAAVDAFHAAGLAAGGRDNGGPGLRADYGANYYPAFLFDPDGTNVEAVCLAEQG